MVIHDCWELRDAPLEVVNFVHDQYNEHRKQYSFAIAFLTGKEHVLWIEEAGVPKAAMLWMERDECTTCWIEFVCVAEDAKHKGYYKELRDELFGMMDTITYHSIRRIQYHVDPNNERMVSLLTKRGIKPLWYTYSFDTKWKKHKYKVE